MATKEFEKNFQGKKIPDSLLKLFKFQESIDGFESYSDGFGIYDDDNRAGIKTWSKDPEFISKFFPFAQANGSGSVYAIWDNSKETDLEKMPVVVFGDEGGVHVMAENILQLFQIITFDSEPMVDFDGVDFYKDKDDYEPREYLDDYTKWLKKNFNLDPVKKPEPLVKAAQKLYKKDFNTWFKKYAALK